MDDSIPVFDRSEGGDGQSGGCGGQVLGHHHRRHLTGQREEGVPDQHLSSLDNVLQRDPEQCQYRRNGPGSYCWSPSIGLEILQRSQSKNWLTYLLISE